MTAPGGVALGLSDVDFSLLPNLPTVSTGLKPSFDFLLNGKFPGPWNFGMHGPAGARQTDPHKWMENYSRDYGSDFSVAHPPGLASPTIADSRFKLGLAMSPVKQAGYLPGRACEAARRKWVDVWYLQANWHPDLRDREPSRGPYHLA